MGLNYPVNYSGAPAYFNKDGSPSLAVRWAGGASAAGGASTYAIVEIGPAATGTARPFYVLGFNTNDPDHYMFVFKTTATTITANSVTVAANTENEFGSVATTSVIKKGTTTVESDEATDTWAAPSAMNTPGYITFPIPLYIKSGEFFSMRSNNENTAMKLWFHFAEVVQP